MRINTEQSTKNKEYSVYKVNLGLNAIILGGIALLKISSIISKTGIIFNVFDILTVISAVTAIIYSFVYSKRKNELKAETISISITAIALLMIGISLFMNNDPIAIHKTIYVLSSIVMFGGVFIAFSMNKVGLNVDKNEVPNLRLNFIMAIVGAVIALTLIVITNYIAKKYYNGTLTILIGSTAIIFATLYSMVASINIKKIRRSQN